MFCMEVHHVYRMTRLTTMFYRIMCAVGRVIKTSLMAYVVCRVIRTGPTILF